MVSQTSLLAYWEVKPKVGTKQEEVYRAIVELGRCYDTEIAEKLGWTINRITNRRGELYETGLIEKAGMGKNKNGYTVQLWQARLIKPKK
jgi:predicted transcriptional regulator